MTPNQFLHFRTQAKEVRAALAANQRVAAFIHRGGILDVSDAVSLLDRVLLLSPLELNAETDDVPALLQQAQEIVLGVFKDRVEPAAPLGEPIPTAPERPADYKIPHRKSQKKSRDKFRRRIQPHESGPFLQGEIKSLSKDDGTRWHQAINRDSGEIQCDCPDAKYRHGGSHNGLCKHQLRLLGVAQRRVAA